MKFTAPLVGKSNMVAKIMSVEWMYIVDLKPLTGMYRDGKVLLFPPQIWKWIPRGKVPVIGRDPARNAGCPWHVRDCL